MTENLTDKLKDIGVIISPMLFGFGGMAIGLATGALLGFAVEHIFYSNPPNDIPCCISSGVMGGFGFYEGVHYSIERGRKK
jgi:hypothetical protein